MKLIAFLFLVINFSLSAQLKLSGEWQGILIESNQTWKEGKPIYLKISVINGLIDGKIREEFYNSSDFSVIKISGKTINTGTIELTEERILKQTEKVTNPCLRQLKFVYDEKSGYFEGVFESKKCPSSTGKIILFKSKFEFHERNESLMNHSWFLRFNADLESGLSSPTKRLEELKAFNFEFVYFDYGEDILKEEYKSYLLKMIKMVKSHSDLRIKITGHTDSDGSDSYNDQLSKRRTEAIIIFFEANGLRRDRVITDYKGEKKPVDSNKTEEGKRKNRRVDFEFY